MHHGGKHSTAVDRPVYSYTVRNRTLPGTVSVAVTQLSQCGQLHNTSIHVGSSACSLARDKINKHNDDQIITTTLNKLLTPFLGHVKHHCFSFIYIESKFVRF